MITMITMSNTKQKERNNFDSFRISLENQLSLFTANRFKREAGRSPLSNSKHAKIGLTNFRFSRQAQYTCHILGSQTVDSLKSSFDVVFSRDNRLVSKCSNRGMRGRRRGEVDRLESWQSLDNASIVRATPLEQAFPRVSMVVIESGGKKGMKNY